MDVKQEAKLNMYRATERHVDDNASIIAANVAFQTAFNKFKTNNIAIGNTAQQKGAVLTGISADKTQAKQKLCQIASDTANYMFAYASANSDNNLKQEINFPLTTLLKTRDEQLAPVCQNIHDKAAERVSELKDYGINAALLTELQIAIDNYSAATPKPRTAASRRKTLTANLSALFKENDAILKDQMDRLIGNFRADHPDFVQTYENTRIILDAPVTATQLKGIITNKSDDSPIKGAEITIVELGRTEKTKSNGEYLFKPIKNDTYTIRVTATGFEDFETDEVQIKLGEIKHLDVSLASR